MILIADSGSTKTDWVLTRDNGCIEGRFKTEGINPFHQSEDDILTILQTLPLPFTVEGEELRLCFYGSGVRPELEPKMARLLQTVLPKATVEAHNDLLGAARAVCGQSPGIACILGTGANSCLYDGDDIVQNTPPLGYILGDEGSGAVMGKLLVGDVLKKQLPQHLCDKFMKEYDLDYTTIITSVYRKPAANRFLAQFAPFLEHNIEEPSIHAIVLRSFTDFFTRNVASYPGYKELPCNFVGSIAYCQKKVLQEAADALGITIGTVIKDPMEGLVKYHSTEA